MPKSRNVTSAFVAIIAGLVLTGAASAETPLSVEAAPDRDTPAGFVQGSELKTRMVIEREVDRLVQGQRQTLTAEWCVDDDCEPAEGLRWSTDTPAILRIESQSGSTVEVTGLKPGIGYLSASNKKTGFSPTIWVYPKPGTSDPPAAVTPRRVDVAYPNEAVLRVGQHLVLTAWRCPSRNATQLGDDGVPGTRDDACRTRELRDVTGYDVSGMSLVGIAGQSAVVVAERYVGSDDYRLVPDPVRLAPADRAEKAGVRPRQVGTSHVYVRDADHAGALLGDLDRDGAVDETDLEVISVALDVHGPTIAAGADGWQKALDLNLDRRIGQVDRDLMELLVRSHAAQIEPEPLGLYAESRRGDLERLSEGPPPEPTATPTPVPTTTPTQ